ncbi:MAG: GAF domain-containing protein [Verrucomicrobia bacterium]|nr:GAF domain-containing protein [Verrucomicrobiota bacterium]
MRLFNRFYDVQTAGIYLQDSLKTIRRQAYIGSDDGLTEIINLDDDLLARKCLATNCPVSIKTFSDLDVSQIHHLVALPVSTSSNEASGVIFINAMPFNRLTEASVEGMELLAHWASRALEVHHERWLVEMVGDQRVDYKVISNEAFSDIIHIAKRTSSSYQIPSFMVLLYANGADKNIEEQLKNRFLPQIRRGDFVTTLDLPFSNIAVLLPVAGRRSVEIFLDRMNEVISSNPQLTGKIRNITKIVDEHFDLMQFQLEVKNIGNRRDNALV